MNPGLFNAIQRGVDLKLVTTKGATGPDPGSPFAGGITFVLGTEVAASGAVRDYADLRGRPIAISRYRIIAFSKKPGGEELSHLARTVF